ncbi:MAG: hypothetical protein IKQ39_08485 [Oscillospiraceae bacterium]|nr:hypothetical protein [Oscillospiraceae bacterium]
MQLQTITAEELLQEIHKKHVRQRTIAMIAMIVGILLTAFFFLVSVGFGIFFAVATVLIPLAIFCYLNSKAQNTEGLPIFKRYGTPDELASMLRSGGDKVIYQANNFLMTETFILNPHDLESLIPLTDIQLVYIFKNSTNGIPTDQGMKVHDIYNNQVQFQFKLGKKGREEIAEIMRRMSLAAPWIVFGYSPQNVGAAARNKIQLGDPKPVRQRPEDSSGNGQ